VVAPALTDSGAQLISMSPDWAAAVVTPDATSSIVMTTKSRAAPHTDGRFLDPILAAPISSSLIDIAVQRGQNGVLGGYSPVSLGASQRNDLGRSEA
jgi:hypothetical protein